SFFLMRRGPPSSTLFPYTTLFRSLRGVKDAATNGRGGLGTILVWASGNGQYDYDQGNKDAYGNSMYVLAVGAATNKGLISYIERSEEHTSELQSLAYLVCRLLLEK